MMQSAPRSALRAPRPDAGFSLVEVLIAMLILAIGLLGLAALQAQSMRFNNDSYSRSQATMLAHDVIDRIRANRDNMADYTTENLTTLMAGACTATGAVTVASDLTCWLDHVQAALPSPIAPTIAANGTTHVDITLTWLDREARLFSADAAPAVPRLPASSDECLYPDGDASGGAATQYRNRVWVGGGTNACLVSQTWTVRP